MLDILNCIYDYCIHVIHVILDVHGVCSKNTFAQHKMAKMKLGVILKGKVLQCPPPLHSEKMWIIIMSFYSVLFGLIIELNYCAIIFFQLIMIHYSY